MNFLALDVDGMIEYLDIMGLGMVGIFASIGLIMFVIWLLNKVFPGKK
ncbi:MAG TPA: oxaloacetate decarboxylase [Clostridiales bacterium]|nr:oxaloacetate decarboxylase [Clostridiales bacterium]